MILIFLILYSGYDFGYLLKMLTGKLLPDTESEFFELLKIFFPTIDGVKYLMKSCKNLKGGLEEVAKQLEIERIGPQHQADSDNLMASLVFFKMKELLFEDSIDEGKYSGHSYGLGHSTFPAGGFVYENKSP
ncbi:unnamed protein product [Rotaria sp. Silwood2]|nr:unnamed protein product [Rotaria sp. Silwood2]CAF3250880.1 unnamed protein product [Rotaria sp. Silwood2]